MGRTWWIAYHGPDGERHHEPIGSERKSDAERLVQLRVGARDNGLPVVPRVEHLTFADAAQAVVDDFEINKKPSRDVLKLRIDKHLTPYFGGRRLASIGPGDIAAYVAHRQRQGIIAWKGPRKGERIADVSNSEINRELTVLRRIFSLAMDHEKLARRPKISLLAEPPARRGFFEADEIAAVLRHLPEELQAVVEFGYITGWRVASEVLPLEWSRVSFEAGEVKLEAGATKNGDARTFPMTTALRRLLLAQHVKKERLKKAGHIEPLVFYRMVAEGRGGKLKPKRILSFNRAWRLACAAAGLPGRRVHDLRRTAVRNLDRAGVSRTVGMKLVGHRTEEIYDRYNITSNADLRQAARKLDAAALAPAKQRTSR
jgi:integrase